MVHIAHLVGACSTKVVRVTGALLLLLLASGCSKDPVEKCVEAYIAAEQERQQKAKQDAGNNIWEQARAERFSSSPAKIEADARLECLRAASGRK